MERDPLPFWERPEIVEKFAGREPDRRLAEWLSVRDDLEGLRVLDVGCAGGRNSVYLARSGCDLYAIDSSLPMVRRTRFRIANVLGEREASLPVGDNRETNGGERDGSHDGEHDAHVSLRQTKRQPGIGEGMRHLSTAVPGDERDDTEQKDDPAIGC